MKELTTTPTITLSPYETRGRLRPAKMLAQWPNGYQLFDNGARFYIRHESSGFNSDHHVSEKVIKSKWEGYEELGGGA